MWLERRNEGLDDYGRALTADVPDVKPGNCRRSKSGRSSSTRSSCWTTSASRLRDRRRARPELLRRHPAAAAGRRPPAEARDTFPARSARRTTSSPTGNAGAGGTTLKSQEEIEAMFNAAGVKPGDTIIGYCHIGQQATAMLFAARTLGHNVLLYDGSFTEWQKKDPAGREPVRAEEGQVKYSDPYVAGVGLGLVLLAAFVLTGHGLGASGAFATTAAGSVAALAPDYAAASAYFGRYVNSPDGPWRDWLLFEVIGVFAGGFLSAALAGRLRRGVERGAGVPGVVAAGDRVRRRRGDGPGCRARARMHQRPGIDGRRAAQRRQLGLSC
jgi:hypothetical protein